MKTTYRKLWSENFFPTVVVIILKCLYISLIVAPRALECENSPWIVLTCKCFACEKFWLHFEEPNGCHSRLFENHLDPLTLEILQLP